MPKQLGRLAGVKLGGVLSLGQNELNGPFPEWLLTNNATSNGSLSLTLQVSCSLCCMCRRHSSASGLLCIG